MNTVTVGFLGGPHDGRVQEFPASSATGLPAPVLEVAEPVLSAEEYYRRVVHGSTSALPDLLFRSAAYRLMINRADAGPRLFYVHPSVRYSQIDGMD